jgi:hypothetical protein
MLCSEPHPFSSRGDLLCEVFLTRRPCVILPPFRSTCRFDFSRCIPTTMYLDVHTYKSRCIAKGMYLKKPKRQVL